MDRPDFIVDELPTQSHKELDALSRLSAHADLVRALQQHNLAVAAFLRDGLLDEKRMHDALNFGEHVLRRHGLPAKWSDHAR